MGMSTDRNSQYNDFTVISTWRKLFINVSRDLLTGETARKGLVTLSGQAVTSGTNFLTGIIIGRTLAKEEFGLYMLGFSIVLIVTNLQSSLISTPYNVYSPRLKNTDYAKYTGSTLIHQLALSALAIFSLSVAGITLSLGIGPHELTPVVWALVVVITFIMLKEYVRRIYFAGLRMKTAFILDLFVAVVQIGGLLLLLHLGLLSVTYAYFIVGLACGLPALSLLFWSRREFIFSIHEALADLRRNWMLAKWVCAATITVTLSGELFPWFLAGFHGTDATGIYSACQWPVFLTNPLLLGMGNILGPKTAHAFSQGGRGKLDRVVITTTLVILLPISVICLGLILWGGSIVTLMFGEKYAGYGWVVAILAFYPLISSLALPTNFALIAIERPDGILKSNLGGGVVTLLFGIPLVSLYGVGGAAVATVCSYSVDVSLRLWIYWINIRNVREKKASIMYQE